MTKSNLHLRRELSDTGVDLELTSVHSQTRPPGLIHQGPKDCVFSSSIIYNSKSSVTQTPFKVSALSIDSVLTRGSKDSVVYTIVWILKLHHTHDR